MHILQTLLNSQAVSLKNIQSLILHITNKRPHVQHFHILDPIYSQNTHPTFRHTSIQLLTKMYRKSSRFHPHILWTKRKAAEI